MRWVLYQDLDVGQEFKLEEFSLVVYVKKDEVSCSLQANPHKQFDQLFDETTRSPAPLEVWIE